MKEINYTEFLVYKAFLKVLSKDMTYFDANYIDPISDEIFEIADLFDGKAEKIIGFQVTFCVEDLSKKIPCWLLEHYGWTQRNLQQAIVHRFIEVLEEKFENQLKEKDEEIKRLIKGEYQKCCETCEVFQHQKELTEEAIKDNTKQVCEKIRAKADIDKTFYDAKTFEVDEVLIISLKDFEEIESGGVK